MARAPLDTIEYTDTPSVLLVADSDAGLGRTRHAAAAAGCKVGGEVDPAGAEARLERQVALEAVFMDLQGEEPAVIEPLLDRLQAAAHGRRYRSVISAPLDLVDAVAARTPHIDIQQLCNAGAVEWAMAAALVTTPPTLLLHDVNRHGGPPPRLTQLSDAVSRIASIVASLAEEEAVSTGRLEDRPAEKGAAIDAGSIRAMIRARRMRDDYFKGGLFADPAWDMLLDLMAARLERQPVAVSSLCIAAAVPPTTALRWIKTLTDQGLFVRVADAQDGRRVFIELSDPAAASLEAYLKDARRVSPLVV